MVLEEPLHLGRGLQGEMMVGPDEGERLFDGGVALGGNQSVLEPVTLRGVVVNVVGGDHRHPHALGQSYQLPVARGVPFQEVLLELHVDRAGAVPLQV